MDVHRHNKMSTFSDGIADGMLAKLLNISNIIDVN